MGSGCFCLSHKYPGIEKDFVIGKHLDVFDSPAELIQKIDYYLANNHDRQRIADNGYQLAHSRFTCDNMVENAIEIYKKYEI
jgi:spore maturation protein CgeB